MKQRIIKFRAWNPLGKMYEPFTLGDPNFNIAIALEKNWPIMQFTGLLDKNGKEIYEGDFVQELTSHKRLHIIEWNQSECRFQSRFDNDMLRHIPDMRFMEIIGNIYENPELLK